MHENPCSPWHHSIGTSKVVSIPLSDAVIPSNIFFKISMRWVGPRHMVSTLKWRPVEHGPKQQFYIVQHITFLYNSSILPATNVPNASRFLTVLDCHPCYKYSIRYRLILKKSKLFFPNVCFISCFKSVCDKFCQNLTRVNCTAHETLPG